MACQAPLSMGFPRHEYWSGFAILSPGNKGILNIFANSLLIQFHIIASLGERKKEELNTTCEIRFHRHKWD